MKIAALIQCHKNPRQINLLLNKLDHPDIDCFLHVDKKANFVDEITKSEHVFVLPDEKRVSVEWMIRYLKDHKEYYRFYENTVCPDESFFQTLVMMSSYADENTDYLTYLHFQAGANSPDILRKKDMKAAKESKCLIMRKVDMDIDDAFLSV